MGLFGPIPVFSHTGARAVNESSAQKKKVTTGGCLCGGVRYEIHGEVLDVFYCHCSKCRRFHGNYGAYTSAYRRDLVFRNANTLKWFHSTTDETPDVYRGFCRECGSSLFWDPRGKPRISIAAGSLDPPSGLAGAGHVWVSQKGDYYEITDKLVQYQERFARADI